MKANLILILLEKNLNANFVITEPEYGELETLGLIEGISLTEKGKNLVKFLENSTEYFQAHSEAKEAANEILDKAKSKYNSFLEAIKL